MSELIMPEAAWKPPTNAEVMACGKKNCKTCRGTGAFKEWVYIRAMPCENLSTIAAATGKAEGTGPCRKKCVCEKDTQVKVPKVCRCAVKRWEKKHGVNILTGKTLEIKRDPFTGVPLSL
jgi:hypothetical protein